MPQTTYIRRVAARAPIYGSESHMSRYVHGSGRDDAQLNSQPQSRFPKIPGLEHGRQSPPVVHRYRCYPFFGSRGEPSWLKNLISIRCGRASA